MQIGKQIQKKRERLNMTQDQLANKLYVSRQTVSNWENDRHYPDIENLLLLSVLFDTSLDQLVKGDVPNMKKKVFTKESNRDAKLMIACWIIGIVTIGPSLWLPSPWFYIIVITPFVLGFIPAIHLEYLKHKVDVRTYKEIIAYEDNKDIEKIRTHRNWVRDQLHQWGLAIGIGVIILVITVIVAIPFMFLYKYLH
ncbi:MAG: helix-turn-helix domain-containing protein [Liquorilactobacillus nagelii]|jgi:transcriptional regulator with XRE-family HTH domain|uniref:helix-turn-helix domain-containing protein n=1 Tax=Liquorilactobacillus nagelii TaxID=82688 RepID=UPI00243024E7|nr:helix-turn-helix domain-containing protein [Liquorilactobacillus nagelii]MCI1633752.1 helix-turn-helix domain-containing protein [Liquorilactobacillus nagelii]